MRVPVDSGALLKVDGQCHCGAVRIEAEVDPALVTVCHCTDCQILTGTAFRTTGPAASAAFRVVAGEPSIKVYVKRAESGNLRAQAFCSECGTPIYAAPASGDVAVYGVRVGLLRQRAQLAPHRQIWCKSALPWTPTVSGLPGVQGQS